MIEIIRPYLLQLLQTHLDRWNEFCITSIDLAHYLCFATSFGYYVPNAINRSIEELKREGLIKCDRLLNVYYFYK